MFSESLSLSANFLPNFKYSKDKGDYKIWRITKYKIKINANQQL
jgi:hypothetical protein